MNRAIKVVLCDDCREEFVLSNKTIKSQYLRHMDKHKVDKATCQCKIDFKFRKEKATHIKVVHEGFKGCDKCLDLFRSDAALEKHRSTHESIPCSECGVVYNGKHALHAHMMRAHDEMELVCDICSKVLRNNALLIEHKNDKHKYKDQSCKICFKKVSKMRENMLSLHTDDKQKPFQCEQCEKGFSSKKYLKHHEFSVHLKSRPFKCRYDCGMDYNDPSNMYQHEKRKHGRLFNSKIENN